MSAASSTIPHMKTTPDIRWCSPMAQEPIASQSYWYQLPARLLKPASQYCAVICRFAKRAPTDLRSPAEPRMIGKVCGAHLCCCGNAPRAEYLSAVIRMVDVRRPC